MPASGLLFRMAGVRSQQIGEAASPGVSRSTLPAFRLLDGRRRLDRCASGSVRAVPSRHRALGRFPRS